MSAPLTPEQRAILRRLRYRYGNKYKSRIRDIWERANPKSDEETALYCLRNTHGPSWLTALRPSDFEEP